MSTSDMVAGPMTDGTVSGNGSNGRGSSVSGVTLHPQDLVGINLSAASRDLMDVTSMARLGRDDMGRGRDGIHRPRDIQRALEVLGSLETAADSGINPKTV
jgi:hypothetical protein